MAKWTTRIAYAYVKEVRAQTVCAECGAQPIDWHDPGTRHEDKRNRPGRMAKRGASKREIDEEIARCIPLCRHHHMIVDGRAEALAQLGRNQGRQSHCRAGHKMTKKNTYVYFHKGREMRMCRKCRADRAREFRQRKKEKQCPQK